LSAGSARFAKLFERGIAAFVVGFRHGFDLKRLLNWNPFGPESALIVQSMYMDNRLRRHVSVGQGLDRTHTKKE
jgi:hypothetical protein